MMNNVKNKIVFITGGSSGYGKAAAKTFTKEGATVIIAARNENDLIIAKQETNCDSYIVLDVTKVEDWLKAEKFVIEKYGKIDILINNAGGGIAIKDTVDQTFENIDKIIALNLNSVVYGSKVFAKYMKEQKSGTIINVSSVCATHCWPGYSVYGAAKAGVLNFSKSLYVELQQDNVRVTCIIPAAANTKFAERSGQNIGKLVMTAQDVADTMLYVCNLPDTAVVEEVTVWGIDQIVNPL